MAAVQKILGLLLGFIILGGCATVPSGAPSMCGGNLARPSYFAQGEKLAAFRVDARAKGKELAGILQIKKQDAQQYEIMIFSAVGAYRLLQGTLTREGMKYSFLSPAVNHVSVKVRVERFLNLLLLPSLSEGVCKYKKDELHVHYKHPIKKYIYLDGAQYPSEVTGPKAFGKLHLHFADYAPYGEEGALPYTLHYKDGEVILDLTLLRLKK